MKNPTVRRKKGSVRYSNKNDNLKNIYYCAITIIGIVFLICFYFFTRPNNQLYKSIKIDSTKDIIYTKYSIEDKNYPITIPFVNINSEDVLKVNEDIDNFVEWYLANSNSSIVTYRYETSSGVLSLLIRTVSFENQKPSYDFRSYIIDLGTLKVLSNDEVLSQFGLNSTSVYSYFDENFHNYYNDLVESGIYNESKCNYGCFLKSIDVSDYGEGISYYISRKSLIAFRPFRTYGNYHEERYFKDFDFTYVLVD